ncbi:potassium-transporting ATPase subunit C [Mycobacterium asiaticum]|uniref:Potassium-transporting ATPase KdpC subunit n=1 Tax=Mycobacterium asiaticum TaxID=1790 RepID=A0A1A3N9Y3_MYCAS|nr:potassium-transporting ATPase subunit C [Mycobacterium asiaticum]OBK18601.1 K+-transporting ATPase subunit C [Mycobacterium asiaticum]
MLRRYWAALRALLVFTVVLGMGYPLLVWLVGWIPGLHGNAQGSLVQARGQVVGSRLLGQSYLDAAGNPLPQYFQGRPSTGSYDPMASGGGNLGPESVVDTPAGIGPTDPGFKSSFRPSLLTLVCSRSAAVAKLEGVDGSRPFCTGGGVGAVLSVIGPRDARGYVTQPVRVVSVNEPCTSTRRPFLDLYEGVRVQCAAVGEDYSDGQIVPIRGVASAHPRVPADAVTASGSGLDPDISPAYADLQIPRVARSRHVGADQIREVVMAHQTGRTFGVFGEPTVNVLQTNLELDRRYPVAN